MGAARRVEAEVAGKLVTDQGQFLFADSLPWTLAGSMEIYHIPPFYLR